MRAERLSRKRKLFVIDVNFGMENVRGVDFFGFSTYSSQIAVGVKIWENFTARPLDPRVAVQQFFKPSEEYFDPRETVAEYFGRVLREKSRHGSRSLEPQPDCRPVAPLVRTVGAQDHHLQHHGHRHRCCHLHHRHQLDDYTDKVL